MDLNTAIQALRAECVRLDTAITQLEALILDSGSGIAPARRSTRGRKFMGEAERREVSVRMKRYWAGRRGARGAK